MREDLSMTVTVRDADAELDAGACAAIYAPYVTDTAISFEQVPPTREQFAERIRNAQREHAWLTAQDDGRVVGYAYGHRFAEREAYRWACEVSIYLASEACGQGIGTLLYTTLLERLAARGFRTALAGVTQPNPASASLHRAQGFEQCAVYRGVGHKHGEWRDVAWYQRSLGPGVSAPPA